MPPQNQFCLSRAEDANFESMHGYLDWLKIRDLGLSGATNGAYEGEGEFVLKAGDFVYHPPGHVHDFMEYSEDIEKFELASPADHSCVDV